MKRILAITSLILTFGCSEDTQPPETQEDMDVSSDPAPDTEDTEDMELDVRPDGPIYCDTVAECPRGHLCDFGECHQVRGCVVLIEEVKDEGCWFDHGEGFPEGYYSAVECETDADCTNADEPSCIARVCSALTPCDEDTDCGAEQECYASFYCL